MLLTFTGVFRKHEEIVDGELVSGNTITACSPPWEIIGADEVDVRVSLGGEAYTVNRVKWGYYINTMPKHCLAYGPGIISPCFWGLPAIFRIQARDSMGKNRTSGLDPFETSVRRRLLPPSDDTEEVFDEEGRPIEYEDVPVQIEDNGDGSYEITFVPSVRDTEYVVSASLDGEAIRGSPWTVETADPWIHAVKVLAPSNAPIDMQDVGFARQGSRMIVYGGSTSTVSVLDLLVFRWDSHAISTGSPRPRRGHSIVSLDSEKGLILHGNRGIVDGVDQGYCDDIQIVSGDKTGWRWTQVQLHSASEVPSMRTHAAACLLPGVARRVFVHGGLSHDGMLLDDSFILKFQNPAKAEWQRLKNTVNPAYLEQFLAAQAQSTESQGGGVFAMKAAQESQSEDLNESLKLPGARRRHHVFSLDKESVLLFGGIPFSAQLIVGDIKEQSGIIEWRVASVAGLQPTPRRDFDSAVNEGQIIIYGGYDSAGKILDDMFVLDTKMDEDSWRWRCMYSSDAAWLAPASHPDRLRTLGVLNKGTLVLLLGSKGAMPCEEVHLLEFDKLLEATTVNAKMMSQIVDDLAAVQGFLKTEYDLLNQEIPSAAADVPVGKKADEEEEEMRSKIAWSIFASLYRVRENGEQARLTLDVVQEVLTVLRRQGSTLERIGEDLDECLDLWRQIEKLAPKVMDKTQWMRAIEMVQLRERVGALDERVSKFATEVRRKAAYTFVMNVENSFREIGEMYDEIEELNAEAEALEFDATVFGIPEIMQRSLEKLRVLRGDLVGVRQLWCFISMYDSYLHLWGQSKWMGLDCSAGMKQFADLLGLLSDLLSARPAQREWELVVDLRISIKNLLTSFEIFRGLQEVYVRERHWDGLKTIVGVRNLPHQDESFMLQNLLSLDLFSFEDDINDLLIRSRSEFEMEGVLKDVADVWTDAEFRFERSDVMKCDLGQWPNCIMRKCSTFRRALYLVTLLESQSRCYVCARCG